MVRKRHKRSYGPPKDEEATWIYSYADMMSLITCFFILFYSVSNTTGELAQDVVESIKQSFNKEQSEQTSSSLVGFNSSLNNELRAIHLLLAVLNLGDSKEEFLNKVSEISKAGEDLESAKEIIKEDLKESLSEEKKKNKESIYGDLVPKDKTIDIVLPMYDIFINETTTFSDGGKKQLIKIALSLQKVSTLSKFEILGHTSHVKPKNSNYKSNWELSAARAGVVAELFIKHGVNPDLIEARGVADVRPLYPIKDVNGEYIEDNVKKNSRIEITLKKKF